MFPPVKLFMNNSPVNKSPLGIHQVELVVEPSPGLGDGGGVGQHADGTLDLGKISTGHDSWRLKKIALMR